jgi:hypothetical protein
VFPWKYLALVIVFLLPGGSLLLLLAAAARALAAGEIRSKPASTGPQAQEPGKA